jgi:hypothetical protein
MVKASTGEDQVLQLQVPVRRQPGNAAAKYNASFSCKRCSVSILVVKGGLISKPKEYGRTKQIPGHLGGNF